ncbi:MAG: hypothetical protein EOP48_27990, partial [Sphingobacteriales bacterium]
TYRALTTTSPGQPPKVDSLPLPKPGDNQILVKVAYAPINPSDIASMYGGYVKKDILIGLEGAGTVVALGENLKVPFTVGQKVHLRGPGTMAQYILVDSFSAWPVQGDLSLENASAHIVNPGTAVYMATLAAKGGHKAAIHTAGSSALGRMILISGLCCCNQRMISQVSGSLFSWIGIKICATATSERSRSENWSSSFAFRSLNCSGVSKWRCCAASFLSADLSIFKYRKSRPEGFKKKKLREPLRSFYQPKPKLNYENSYFTLSIYSPVRVSTLTLSPWLMNIGTFISTPVSTVAYFNAFVEVSPFTAGSVYVISSST